MKYKLFTYNLPCRAFVQERKGLLLSWTDHRGNLQWSEASPLPGRSRETLQEVLVSFQNSVPTTPYPSVNFALDHPPLPPSDFLIPYCGLLTGTPREIHKMAVLLAQEQVQHAKLKVAQLPLADAIAIARELLPTFHLRIDANRAWDLDTALQFASHFPPDAFSFFEEPLSNPLQLEHFPYPLALDESLLEPHLDNLLKLPHLRALVVKPTLCGGYHYCLKLAHYCLQHNLKLVLSSAFESGVGIIGLARLMHALPREALLPAGFDTYRYLAHDLLVAPLVVQHGYLHLPTTIEIIPDIIHHLVKCGDK